MNLIETINIHGITVEIYRDSNADSPRWDCSSTLCTAHRRYTFGGERLPAGAMNIEQAFDWHLSEKSLLRREIIYETVYLYEHGSIALNTIGFSCPYDSGRLGFIYEVREDIRKEFGVQRISHILEQKIRDRIKSEINVLEQWANGEVYICRIPEIDEEAYGFYGDDHKESGLIDFAASEIEAYIAKQRYKHYAYLKRLIKGHVNINYRSSCPV